jgi:hypothetical protein
MFSSVTFSQDEKILGIVYYKNIFGHLHQNPVALSASLTSLSCGFPVKLIESNKINLPSDWEYVQVGEHKGFILKKFLMMKRPECFQGKYPNFVNKLNLDLTQNYYWARLYDQYVLGESLIK